MQSIFQSMTSLISNKINEAQGTPGNLGTNMDFTKAEVLQAEEAERERRIKSYEFKECALANAKYASNVLRSAGFPQPVYLQGTKKRTRLIEEMERSRRVQNQEESDARRAVSNTVAGSINSLGWPFVAKATTYHEPSVVRREIDESLNKIASLVSQQALCDVKRSEEQERQRRETDVEGQQMAIGSASRVSLDLEGHMVDAITREERERERRRDSKSEIVAKSNANEVARLVQNYRDETLSRSQSLPVTAEQEALNRAGSKVISDMILDARRAFELVQTTKSSTNDVLPSEFYQPETQQISLNVAQLIQPALIPVLAAPQEFQAVQPPSVAREISTSGSLLQEAVPIVIRDPAPVVQGASSSPPKSVTFNQPTFARTYSTAGSMSPMIFPLRRSAPVASSKMRDSGDSQVTPHYNVVIVPDPVTPLDSARRSFKAPELSRATSSNALTEAPKEFVAHPLSRSLSAHELSFMKKEATKHEKMSIKQIKQAEKLLQKSEKLKSKGKHDKAKKKEVKAFELRKEALKHEETANKNKFGTVVLTPALPSM